MTSVASDESPLRSVRKSFAGTASKTGTSLSVSNIVEMMSGHLKFQYSDQTGEIKGRFKLSDNPSAIDFGAENVARRGSRLLVGSYAICLVLNVGD